MLASGDSGDVSDLTLDVLSFSDTHLFHPLNGAMHYQASIIEAYNARRLEWVGDGIDYEKIWVKFLKTLSSFQKQEFKKGDLSFSFNTVLQAIDFPRLESHLRFLDMLFAKVASGVEVVYYPGNHDENLMVWDGKTIEGIHFKEREVVKRGGYDLLIQHGHQIDPGFHSKYRDWVYGTGARFVDGGMIFDHYFLNPLLEGIGKRFSSAPAKFENLFLTTEVLKAAGKGFGEKRAIKAVLDARSYGANAVMNGHTHKRDVAIISQRALQTDQRSLLKLPNQELGLYLNTGDGFNHGTALAYKAQKGFGHKGFASLTRCDAPLSPVFTLKAGNPYAEYREQTMRFLEAAWQTCEQYVRNKHASSQQHDRAPAVS